MEDLIFKSRSVSDFRNQAKQLTELIAARFEASHSGPVKETINWENPEDQLAYWQEDFNSPVITDPLQLFDKVVSKSINLHSRGYMGHQVPPPLPVTVLTSALMAFLNNGMAVYEMGMAGNAMEKIITAYLAGKFGLGAEASGIITSGGSLGNLTALLAARASIDASGENFRSEELAVMVSGEAHYSIERAVKVMGIPAENIIRIPVNEHYSMCTDLLPDIYRKTTEEGKKVFCIIACACSTSTGSYDDLESIGRFAKAHEIWFHVDGAHGGAVIFSSLYRHLLAGVEMADSVVLDFHKMMMVPSLSTAVLFRSRSKSKRTFLQKANYLWQDQQSDEWYSSGKQTFECTKPMTILHTYTIMRLYGDELYRQHVEKLHGLTKVFVELVKANKNFELACEPQSNIVCFRYFRDEEDNDELNRRILQALLEDGTFYIVNTLIGNLFYLRVSLMNPMTDKQDFEQLLIKIIQFGNKALTYKIPEFA